MGITAAEGYQLSIPPDEAARMFQVPYKELLFPYKEIL